MLVVKNLLANAGDKGDVGLIPGSGRSPEERNGNPLQYSYLGNPIDRGAWCPMAHRVTKSQIRLKQLSTHFLYMMKSFFSNNYGIKQMIIMAKKETQRVKNLSFVELSF